MIRWILSDLYGMHIYLLKSDLLDENEKEYYKRIYARDIALQEQDLAKAMEAFKQIEELAYSSEFEQRQINKVWTYRIAFSGKKICLYTDEA